MTIVTRLTMAADDDSTSICFVCFLLFLLITAIAVAGDSLDSDREVLLSLKSHLESLNPQNRGMYTEWVMEKQGDVCKWPGIICTPRGSRVTGINLSDSTIAGGLFGNFSALTQLTYLDLSRNTIGGTIPDDLSRCHNLKHLNLSHNILHGELSLPGLSNLEVLDLSLNRFAGEIESSFPLFCNSLIVANLSTNNFTGRIDNIFNGCPRLKYVDFSTNGFSGEVWTGFGRLVQFSVADNYLSGHITASMFRGNCILEVLDLSGNRFGGAFPGQVSNCQNLSVLNLWGNDFEGKIPAEIGSISSLRGLYLGNNTFSRDIPETLLNLTNLVFLDLSRNKFGGDIQEIFGRFTQVKYLVLHWNSYVGGIESSNILKLPNLSRLDLSYNNFSGQLPPEISQIQSLKFLILAYNNFSGEIPQEYGNMPGLQALDLSFNRLTGSIPASFGNLTSLLWLMLANNSLSGEIPREIGNCRSLLWFNVANNQLSGRFHPELTKMGSNPFPTFEVNRQNTDKIIAGSGECLAMKRWIPAEFPPFNFVYAILTKKSCRSLWNNVLKGYGLFPVCSAGSTKPTYEISAYLQLSGNKLSGEVPADISQMEKLSTLHLGFNEFEGKLPPEIGRLPIAFLNLTRNKFSGHIPQEIGNLKCLQNLDLSYNNFSGTFPTSLIGLNELSKFNISYNPFISGTIPTTGQMATFDKESFLGNPLLHFPSFFNQSGHNTSKISNHNIGNRPRTLLLIWISLALALAFIACLVVSGILLMVTKASRDAEVDLLDGSKARHDMTPSSGGSSPWLSGKIKVIRLDKSTFTYADILKATSNFSEERVVGRGGYGTVYKGVLPDGKEVAVKKLQREGLEAEKEFRAEMEVLSANAFGDWAHPNLVRLYGWCLDGSEKILVHEYMGGGSLEELITDKIKLPWRKRIDIATDVARALVFLHHECYPSIVHRDVKASNVLLDKHGNARVTDFGLARLLDVGDSHVSTVIAGTIGYVAPEYGQTWQATTRGDVYSYGVLTMELATGRRAVDGGEECLLEWARRVMTDNVITKGSPFTLLGTKPGNGAEQLTELLKVGVKCTADQPQARPNMKEVLSALVNISGKAELFNGFSSPDYREM